MKLGYAIPTITGLRGAGLGNEAIPWAKAYIAARTFNLRAVHPAWGMNQRRYYQDFETSRLDWFTYQSLRRLPHLSVTTEDFQNDTDYGEVVKRLKANAKSKPRLVIDKSGMYGGYLSIRSAKDFLRRELLFKSYVIDNLYDLKHTNSEYLTVTMHVRRGDFEQAPEIVAGTFNFALPYEWYIEVGRRLGQRFGKDLKIYVCSDSPKVAHQISAQIGSWATVPLSKVPLLTDLALMSTSDLLVCSVSSMSMLGAFLSEQCYLWNSDHLTWSGGWGGIWGINDPGWKVSQRNRAADYTSLSGRGFAVGTDDALPVELEQRLQRQLDMKQCARDLIYYGVVRTSNKSLYDSTAIADQSGPQR